MFIQHTVVSAYSYSVLQALEPKGILSDEGINMSEFRSFIFLNPYTKYHLLGQNAHRREGCRTE